MITHQNQQNHSVREFMRGGRKYVELTQLSAQLPGKMRMFNVLTLIPGASIGTTNMLMPACGGFAAGSVRAARNMYWPHQVVVQIYWPVMTHASPSRTALVRSDTRSLPASGSL